MIDRQTAKPIPKPFFLVVKNASKILSGSLRPVPVSRISTNMEAPLRLDLTNKVLRRSETDEDEIEDQLLQLNPLTRDQWQTSFQFGFQADILSGDFTP
jgi:hypothetical protein